MHIAGRRRRRYRQWMSRMSRMFAAPSNETRYSRRQSSDNLVVVIVATVLVENRFVNQFFTASFPNMFNIYIPYIYIKYIYIINYKNITCIRDARREYFDGFVVFRRPKKLSDPAGYRNFLNDTGYTNVGAFSLTFVIFLNIERQPGIHHPFDNRKKPNETFQQLLPLFLLVPI